jgi:hypothetical protein
LGFDEEVSSLLCGSSALDEVSVHLVVLGVVLFGVCSGLSSGSFPVSLGFSTSVFECLGKLSVSGLLLKNVFGDNPGSRVGDEKEKRLTLLPSVCLKIKNIRLI